MLNTQTISPPTGTRGGGWHEDTHSGEYKWLAALLFCKGMATLNIFISIDLSRSIEGRSEASPLSKLEG